MRELTTEQMSELEGGYEKYTACGIAVGITVGASVFFGVAGFAVTVNKAIATCAVEALT